MLDRYTNAHMERIWNRQAQINGWALVELIWMEQFSSPAADDARRVEVPTPEQVQWREDSETNHEFTAFLNEWSSRFPGESPAHRWLHYGLTSSDVIDTVLAQQMLNANWTLQHKVTTLHTKLTELGMDLANVTQVGRTHGQWAEPRSAQIAVRSLASMVFRQHDRLIGCHDDLALVNLSGPTGGRNQDTAALDATIEALGLKRADWTTQIVARDSLVHWAHVVANTVTVCEAVAEHFWMLAQSEVGEVVSRFPGTVASSSAMPHKKNPATMENVRGLGRLARGLVSTLDEGIVQRGDRDLAHSAPERVALPDLCHIAATALQRTIGILRTWEYDTDRVEENLLSGLAENADSFDRVTRAVACGATRKQAREDAVQ